MLSRLRAVVGVALLVALIGGVPGLASRATAAPPAPRNLTIATYDIEPFVMTEGGIKTGFTVDLLDEIAKRTGWTYTYVDRQSVEGILEDVTKRRVDAAAAAISITAARSEVLDFSQPILNAGLQIAVPDGALHRAQPGLMDFLKLLLSKAMAVWLLAALVLTVIPAHIIWLLERRQDDSTMSTSYFPGIVQAFGRGLRMLAAAPYDSPRHWLTRALGVLWAFVSIIFVAYYTATLTASLTVEKFDARINSPGDLVGRKVCAVANTTSTSALDDIGVPYTGLPTNVDCYRGLQDGTYEATVDDAPLLQYWVTHEGAGVAELAGPVFRREHYGIAFPLGSDLRKQADDALLSIRESGNFDLIKQKWLGNDAG